MIRGFNRRKNGATRNFTSDFQKYRNDKGSRIAQYIILHSSFKPISRNLFEQPVEGYDQLLGKGLPRSDAETSTKETTKSSKKHFPAWVDTYTITNDNISILKTKGEGFIYL